MPAKKPRIKYENRRKPNPNPDSYKLFSVPIFVRKDKEGNIYFTSNTRFGKKTGRKHQIGEVKEDVVEVSKHEFQKLQEPYPKRLTQASDEKKSHFLTEGKEFKRKNDPITNFIVIP